MPAQLLDGRKIADKLEANLKIQLQHHQAQGHRAPELAVILLGQDPASELYVRNKQRACTQVGIIPHAHNLPTSTSQTELIELVDKLNSSPQIDGILIQLPLSPAISTATLLEKILPDKDVDGFHPYNLGRLAQKRPLLRPCTPAGIMSLLAETRQNLVGLDATVVGTSNIVGRPMILELLAAGCTVTACHRQTRDLRQHVEKADLLIVATGNPNLIKGEWIKQGAIVIDVGMNRLPNGQFVGDLEFEAARQRASWITPVPGGVGPMTVACLLQNTVSAYEKHLGNKS